MPIASPLPPLDAADAALLRLLESLRARDYRFVTPTPATHARVVARPHRHRARGVEDVLGWSLPFAPGILPDEIERALDAAGMLEPAEGGSRRSRVRVSSLRGRLYLHSAYPTDAPDAVFLGPDSYRFTDLIAAEVPKGSLSGGARIVDIGGGAGVGAIVAAAACPGCRVTMTDINPQALRLARINAAAAGTTLTLVEGSGVTGVEGDIDLALLNPPYIIDAGERAYRDGGGMHGGQLSLDLTVEAAGRLAPGGRAILYTGSAILDGGDPLRDALEQAATAPGLHLSYREIDPDVFGEEMDDPAYADVDRIALVAAILTRPA